MIVKKELLTFELKRRENNKTETIDNQNLDEKS